jgi:predicted RNA binding protein YcfA (HicA-like mRNA interferase family)
VPPLPVVSGDQFVKAMEKLGYQWVRTKGSHMSLRCPGRKPLYVPRHRELDRGTLKGLINDAGVTVDELIQLLR